MPLGGIAAVVRYAAGRVLVFVFVGGVASISRVFVVGFLIFIAEAGAGGALYPPTSLPFLPFSLRVWAIARMAGTSPLRDVGKA